jgi:hypothetical protein
MQDNKKSTAQIANSACNTIVPGFVSVSGVYPEYRLGMTGLWGDVSDAASTSDNTQAAMVPALTQSETFSVETAFEWDS